MSYVYIRSEPDLWTVGFYRPDGTWHPESDHGSSEEAAERVTRLNGGETEDTRRLDGSASCSPGSTGSCSHRAVALARAAA